MTSPSDEKQPFKLQDFDVNDPINIGRPRFFDVNQYLDVIQQMGISDEVERALWMLDNMPGWYRDNKTVPMLQLKHWLQSKISTSVDYMNTLEHSKETQNLIDGSKEEVVGLLTYLHRGNIIYELCKKLNSQNKIPHITELAPGSFWLPIALKKAEIQFTYEGNGLNKDQELLVKDYLKETWINARNNPGSDRPTIFICFELIEHLQNPNEIAYHYAKHMTDFSYIFLSTPKYTIYGGNVNWTTEELGHLRTYTPKEFSDYAMNNWLGRKWTMFDGEVMVLMGEKL